MFGMVECGTVQTLPMPWYQSLHRPARSHPWPGIETLIHTLPSKFCLHFNLGGWDFNFGFNFLFEQLLCGPASLMMRYVQLKKKCKECNKSAGKTLPHPLLRFHSHNQPVPLDVLHITWDSHCWVVFPTAAAPVAADRPRSATAATAANAATSASAAASAAMVWLLRAGYPLFPFLQEHNSIQTKTPP